VFARNSTNGLVMYDTRPGSNPNRNLSGYIR
jgi:hypothetical protein